MIELLCNITSGHYATTALLSPQAVWGNCRRGETESHTKNRINNFWWTTQSLRALLLFATVSGDNPKLILH